MTSSRKHWELADWLFFALAVVLLVFIAAWFADALADVLDAARQVVGEVD